MRDIIPVEKSKKNLQSRIWFFSLVEEENDINFIKNALSDCSAENVFMIRHNKDKIKQDDGTTIPKRIHWHIAIRFKNPTLLSVVANIINYQPCDYHYIQKCKNWKASCRYMLHLDQKEKHLYDIKELEVIKGEKDDYYNVAIGKAQYVTTDADLFPDFGNFDKIPYKQQYLDIYNNVDEPRRQNLLIKELNKTWDNYLIKRKFEMETKNVKVIFIEGTPGSGKSTFAKQLAVNNQKSYCVSSSSNDVLQDYTCEDYLILDDLRDDTFVFADLLKLLDNFVISSVKSRYNNKLFLGEFIVITSAKPLKDWYVDCLEDRTQLFRRVNMFVRCSRTDNVLTANLYLPGKNQPAIDQNGNPNGIYVPTPILNLSEKDVASVEQLWKSLGINVEELAEKYVNDLKKQRQKNNTQIKLENMEK